MVNRIYEITSVNSSHLNNIHNEHYNEIVVQTVNNLDEALAAAKRDNWTIKVKYL